MMATYPTYTARADQLGMIDVLRMADGAAPAPTPAPAKFYGTGNPSRPVAPAASVGGATAAGDLPRQGQPAPGLQLPPAATQPPRVPSAGPIPVTRGQLAAATNGSTAVSPDNLT